MNRGAKVGYDFLPLKVTDWVQVFGSGNRWAWGVWEKSLLLFSCFRLWMIPIYTDKESNQHGARKLEHGICRRVFIKGKERKHSGSRIKSWRI